MFLKEKKYLFLAAGKLITVLFLMLIVSAKWSFAAELSAKLTQIQGKVEVKSSPTASWETAKDGMVLSTGASVKCGAESQAYVGWGKGHVVKVFPLSTASLNKLIEEADGTSISEIGALNGRIFTKVAKLSTPSSAFSVKTPTATAGVRGTGFDANVAEDGKTASFGVAEGSVTVAAGGVEITVAEGMMTSVPEGGAPAEPTELPAEAKAELQQENSKAAAVSEAIQEAKAEKEAAKEEKKEAKEEAKEAKAEAKEEAPAAPTEVAAPEVDTDAIVNNVINNAVQESTINQILQDIIQEIMKEIPCSTVAGAGCVEGNITF